MEHQQQKSPQTVSQHYYAMAPANHHQSPSQQFIHTISTNIFPYFPERIWQHPNQSPINPPFHYKSQSNQHEEQHSYYLLDTSQNNTLDAYTSQNQEQLVSDPFRVREEEEQHVGSNYDEVVIKIPSPRTFLQDRQIAFTEVEKHQQSDFSQVGSKKRIVQQPRHIVKHSFETDKLSKYIPNKNAPQPTFAHPKVIKLPVKQKGAAIDIETLKQLRKVQQLEQRWQKDEKERQLQSTFMASDLQDNMSDDGKVTTHNFDKHRSKSPEGKVDQSVQVDQSVRVIHTPPKPLKLITLQDNKVKALKNNLPKPEVKEQQTSPRKPEKANSAPSYDYMDNRDVSEVKKKFEEQIQQVNLQISKISTEQTLLQPQPYKQTTEQPQVAQNQPIQRQQLQDVGDLSHSRQVFKLTEITPSATISDPLRTLEKPIAQESLSIQPQFDTLHEPTQKKDMRSKERLQQEVLKDAMREQVNIMKVKYEQKQQKLNKMRDMQ